MTAQTMMEATDRLTLAIATAAQELVNISTEMLALDGITCTGTVHWRPSPDDSPAMMYANHRHAQSCPLHGTPPTNGRLRVYVGKKLDRQEKILDAMRLHKRLTLLQHRWAHLAASLDRTYRIDQITQSLQ